ncbi:DUF2249 domain-containing protein [Bradyrhizobium sp. BR13661]|jgi:uncharacterized protein (DUF2249 family)|uniref:DUF2249 domain-containing protein n=1 Tax=Bradyrhizobium sp. BR13661 TaxID=2940622 RepID=UPI00247507EF|nr:DUF2249 domain-containing protein [Bradyrhizobium sp. BR13661]MDH6257608.1 uncharacterized protein (DUF2249 family) [Bradyrhizobium sp. BR13661]
MLPDQGLAEQVIDVRGIPPSHRHPVIFQLFNRLEVGEGFQLVADHDPRPLRYQFDVRYGSRCKWTYLERGPHMWRVRIVRTAEQVEPAYSSIDFSFGDGLGHHSGSVWDLAEQETWMSRSAAIEDSKQ